MVCSGVQSKFDFNSSEAVYSSIDVLTMQVHAEQLRHVERGCLTRIVQDLAADGSRIEGSHKGWNSLMRAFASGLENMNYLSHDHVHRRNTRAANSTEERRANRPFAASGFGSHHSFLVDASNRLWNALVDGGRGQRPTAVTHLPELPQVDSEEQFGIADSLSTASFNGLMKEEDEDEDLPPMQLWDEMDDMSANDILQSMNVDSDLSADSDGDAQAGASCNMADQEEQASREGPDAVSADKGALPSSHTEKRSEAVTIVSIHSL